MSWIIIYYDVSKAGFMIRIGMRVLILGFSIKLTQKSKLKRWVSKLCFSKFFQLFSLKTSPKKFSKKIKVGKEDGQLVFLEP